MADGLFYNDLKAPFTAANIAAVTLSTTFLSLYPLSNFPLLPSGYFSFVGKKMKIRLFGQMTTAATPGNGQFGIYWNADTAAGTTQLATSAAFALVANATNLSWRVEGDIVFRLLLLKKKILATGKAFFPTRLCFSTVVMNQTIPSAASA